VCIGGVGDASTRALKQASKGDVKACGRSEGCKWVVYKILS
jgi:hypothetical protein